MEESSNNKQRKRKVTEGKIFPIPFPIREIKETITISTNTPTKFSKEQIINKAFNCHSQGKISEAAKYYQQLISQGCNDHRVFSN